MNRVLRRAALLVVPIVAIGLVPFASGADEAPASSSATPDVQDLIVLGPTRPLILRLHITIDGQPFRQVWQQRFEELFDSQDSDGDGRLTVEQGDLVARDMNGGVRETPKSVARDSLLRTQAAADQTVDRAVLAAYVQKILPPFSLYGRPLITRSAGLALFPLLDTNQDYQLSETELAAAEEQLKQRDFNDDGVVTAFELILDPAAIADAADPGGGDYGTPQEEPALLLGPGVSGEDVAKRLLERYDRNDDGAIRLAEGDREMVLPEPIAARLDRDSDGSLSREELAAFVDREPDVELGIALGQVSARERRGNRQRVQVEDGWRVRQKLLRGYDLQLGDVEIDLTLNNRNPQQADLYSFTVTDRDDNQYVDLQEAQNSEISADAFAAMDTDDDKKVNEGEFNSFLSEQTAAASVRLQMQVFDRGQDLFSLLDVDVNGVLSPRELRTASNILVVEDKNGDGMLNGSEIPQRLLLELVRGADPPPDEARLKAGHIAVSTNEALSSGPLWFRKMDRNNDTDLTPQEFIGTPATFRKLDANADGLIDVDEAEATAK
jgi:Ca2+-binding EF-hand superfamily protein